MKEGFYVYILTNAHNNVLYVGSTGDLKKRVYFHRKRLISGFSKKYNLHKLVYSCTSKLAALSKVRLSENTRSRPAQELRK